MSQLIAITGDSPTHIEVDAEPRYWEDATVNGVNESDDAPTIFGVDGKWWRVRIRLTDGQIEGWPEGMTADVQYKVCDQGEYYLADSGGRRLMKWKGYYVPDDFLCPTENGYGDYIIMQIGPDGMVKNWVTPAIDPEEWLPLPPSPEKGEG